MKTKSIKQKVHFKASPLEVYSALLDSKKHSAFTGEPAKINAREGGKFTAYGEYISGVNLKLVPGKKLVQTWRASDWEEGASSTATFTFTREKGGTLLEFLHEGIPAEDADNIKKGWIDFYWKPMKGMFGSVRDES